MGKNCKGCPISDQPTELGEQISNYGCLPDFRDARKWYEETGKVWACHEQNTKPCRGFLNRMKINGQPIKITASTQLITESMSLEDIYSV